MGSKKLNVALVFEGEVQSGGGYQTQLSTIIELLKLEKYNFKVFTFSDSNQIFLESLGIKTILVNGSLFDNIVRYINRQEFFLSFQAKLKLKSIFEKIIANNEIDLVYFLSPSILSLDLLEHNYIITVWDLCHRDFPEFPEVNFNREFERREQLYTKALKKAIAILTDSEIGKENIIKRYGIDDNRIFHVSYLPSVNIKKTNFVNIKSKYNISGHYIYYPAQFWAHKNHTYIIDALSILRKNGKEVAAIFSGSDQGNLKYILNYAKQLQVNDLVKYIGFAPGEEIYYLYKQSLALVMPSYFGPTNIPPIEAFYIGTPVIYSDLRGLREQVGDAALLCNLSNPESLAKQLTLLLNNKAKRKGLIKKGKMQLEKLQKNNIINIICKILEEYETKLKCWKY